MAKFGFYIDLPVRTEWSNVDLLRSSVHNCFTAMFADIDGCHSLGMITAELLENAIKYGAWADNEAVFRLRVSGEERIARVTVENPAKQDDPAVGVLFESLRWIKSFPSSEEAYRARLLEVASAPKEVSRLGLARLAYEANCTLTATLESGILKVTAEMPLDPTPKK